MDQQSPQIALIALPEVQSIAGISKTEVFRRIARGAFPEPARLGTRCTRWSRSEVEGWVSDRLAERARKQAA
jgi:prophage regulatory protein